MKLLLYLLMIPLVIAIFVLMWTIFQNPLNKQISTIKDTYNQTNQSNGLIGNIIKATPKPTPKPTPIPLKPDNGTKGTYQIGQGKHDGPSITQAIFDPLDVQKGQKLTLTVRANNTLAISSLSAVLKEDSSSQNINFSLTSGTNIDGIWTGQITLSDSVQYEYVLTITAVSVNGTSSVIVAPRS